MSEDLSTRLSRWSQRKHAARHGAAAEEARREVEKPAAPAEPPADAAPATAEEPPVLPSIDELTADSDFTVFLAKNVPEALRHAALRKLWRSDPVFANLDGLNDYCEDLNLTYEPITLAQTSYKVGRGFLDDVAEKLEKLEPASPGDLPAQAETANDTASQIASTAPDASAVPENEKNILASGDEPATASRPVGVADSDRDQNGQRDDKAN